VPPAVGRIEVEFPSSFDIAEGGTPVCTIVHTDVPFGNHPLWY